MNKKILYFSILATALFVSLKIPMLFTVLEPEELRDLDAYERASQGSVALKDFGWLYGPLGPVVFGSVLKSTGFTVFKLRVAALIFWAFGIFLASVLFWEILTPNLFSMALFLLVTFPFGFPSYAHNHALAFLGLIIASFGMWRYRKKEQHWGIGMSLVGVLIVLFCRPQLMGYGLSVGWIAWIIGEFQTKKRVQILGSFVLCIGVITGYFYATTGPSLQLAFVPQSWLMLPQEGYPNVLLALTWLKGFHEPLQLLKALRGIWDVVFFYAHYLIWPTVLFTLTCVKDRKKRNYTACLLVVWSLLCSLDVLYYGLGDATVKTSLAARAQFFILPAFLSIYLIAGRERRLLLGGVSAFIFLWGLFPYLAGIYQLKVFPTNPYKITTLEKLKFHPRYSAVAKLVDFVDANCAQGDTMVIRGYDPTMLISKCRNAFSQFIYYLDEEYRVRSFETPYTRTGGRRWGDVVKEIEAGTKPRFYVNFEPTEKPCNLPEWHQKVFEESGSRKVLCWHPKGDPDVR